MADARFYQKDINLNIFLTEQEKADYLIAVQDELIADMAEKGFVLRPRFMVLPKEVALSVEKSEEKTAENEINSLSSRLSSTKKDKKGGLDLRI